MASERDAALNAVVPQPSQPPKIDEAISSAAIEVEITKRLEMEHQHRIKMRKAELGWFGLVFGSETHAPIVIAFVVVAAGLAGSAALWSLAYMTGKSEFWSSEAHIALGAATSALTYLFGRGTKGDSK